MLVSGQLHTLADILSQLPLQSRVTHSIQYSIPFVRRLETLTPCYLRIKRGLNLTHHLRTMRTQNRPQISHTSLFPTITTTITAISINREEGGWQGGATTAFCSWSVVRFRKGVIVAWIQTSELLRASQNCLGIQIGLVLCSFTTVSAIWRNNPARELCCIPHFSFACYFSTVKSLIKS